ncbi:hypothetical protein EDD18DRAFT_1360461 [Armillaria luteobubalina]|uniref:Uncharacterized protein n=1 Tax=Armillaria luteobubalina TaxID=153913 RepID=A0AA39UF14_9AGAR|nr:hypothetical protein EDD18DRAFT_1360461 [Armillaria luteobubalina]
MPFQHITNRPRNIERHEPTFTELLNSPNYIFPVNYGGATFGFLGNPTPQDWTYASNGFNSTNEGALSFNRVMFPQPATSSQLAFSQDENYDQTWASHNPEKPVIPKQQRQLQKGQNGEARKINEQWMKMAEEIDAAQDRYHEELKGIAMKYDRSFEAIINLVSYSSRYKKHQIPSLYLAKVSAKAEEVNKEKCVSNKVPLARIQEMIQEEEKHSLHGGLTREEEEALLERLKEKREVKVVLGVNQEINGLAHHTSAHFVGFVSHSNIHDKFLPALITDLSALLSFFKRIIGISAEDMLVKFEQFFCAHLNMNAREDSNTVRSQCTELILQENITGEPSIWMNYVHYDMDIVAQHHVQLEGWPMGIKFEKLANLKNLQDLRRLQDALQTTVCKWVQMLKRQIDEHTTELSHHKAEGETVKKKRRQ